jgi:hypothetical protein
LHLEAWIDMRNEREASTHAHVRDANGRVLAEADAGWALASAGVVARMSGLPRDSVAQFLQAASAREGSHQSE